MSLLPLIGVDYEKALRLAAVRHRHQERRGSGVPYVAHPVAVAAIVSRAGFDEPTAIAALLHDLLEDTATTPEELRDEFGAIVAETVVACSEVKLDAAGQVRSWEERKRDFLASLADISVGARAVILADKLHNLLCIRLDLQEGRNVWAAFHAPRDRVLWYFQAVIDRSQAPDERIQRLAAACRAELGSIRSWG